MARATGQSIAVYGNLGTQSSPFIAVLDHQARQFSANTQVNSGTQLIYFASGLSKDEHTLWLRNNPTGTGPNDANVLNIAFAVNRTAGITP